MTCEWKAVAFRISTSCNFSDSFMTFISCFHGSGYVGSWAVAVFAESGSWVGTCRGLWVWFDQSGSLGLDGRVDGVADALYQTVRLGFEG